jgi:hypothetical protein
MLDVWLMASFSLSFSCLPLRSATGLSINLGASRCGIRNCDVEGRTLLRISGNNSVLECLHLLPFQTM